jgi:molybdenum cofactor biosynthesis enzyme MoaA
VRRRHGRPRLGARLLAVEKQVTKACDKHDCAECQAMRARLAGLWNRCEAAEQHVRLLEALLRNWLSYDAGETASKCTIGPGRLRYMTREVLGHSPTTIPTAK